MKLQRKLLILGVPAVCVGASNRRLRPASLTPGQFAAPLPGGRDRLVNARNAQFHGIYLVLMNRSFRSTRAHSFDCRDFSKARKRKLLTKRIAGEIIFEIVSMPTLLIARFLPSALAISILFFADLALGAKAKSSGSDHVVSACPAGPYKGPSALFTPGTPGSTEEVFRRWTENATGLPKDADYIVHLAEWTSTQVTQGAPGTVQLNQRLVNSVWAAYDFNGKAKPSQFDSNGNPILFNGTNTFLLGVTHFSTDVPSGAVTVGYGTSTTPSQKQNITDLVALIQALAGAAAGGAPAAGVQAKGAVSTFQDAYVAFCSIQQDSSLPLSINISYTVTPNLPAPVSATPGALDFGNQPVGGQTVPQTVTIANNTGNAVNFRAATVTGTNADDFVPTTNGCTAALAPQVSCSIALAFAPKASGQRTATLSVSDDAANSPQTVTLAGVGGAAGGGKAAVAGKGPANPQPNANTPATTTSPTNNSSNQTSQFTNNSTSSAPAPVNCTVVTNQAPCTISRSISDNDREFWDVGLGLSIPGVRERNYNAAQLNAKPTIIVHTDVYAFLDIYLNGNRSSAWPHINFGIPVTGTPFHRPFYGAALPITTWLGLSNTVPFAINLIAGAVDMKQYYVTGEPGAANGLGLKTERTWKPMFGVELPLSQLVSRVSKIGK